MSRIYAYLRASTKEQDANRAKSALVAFCKKHKLKISAFFKENESGTSLNRPELFNLLNIAEQGDVLLVEQVDRISRLDAEDWKTLKSEIESKKIKIVSIDLPTSHNFLKVSDEFTERMLSALNAMMLDMLAAIARKDYDDRKRRQTDGIKKARKAGLYKGRRDNLKLHSKIEVLLKNKISYSEIVDTLSCSRATVAKVRKRLND